MRRINFKMLGRSYTARIFDEVPEEEKLDFNCGYKQFIEARKLNYTSYDGDQSYGYYEFYKVTEFWGNQCNNPEEFEENSEEYYIAVFREDNGEY